VRRPPLPAASCANQLYSNDAGIAPRYRSSDYAWGGYPNNDGFDENYYVVTLWAVGLRVRRLRLERLRTGASSRTFCADDGIAASNGFGKRGDRGPRPNGLVSVGGIFF